MNSPHELLYPELPGPNEHPGFLHRFEYPWVGQQTRPSNGHDYRIDRGNALVDRDDYINDSQEFGLDRTSLSSPRSLRATANPHPDFIHRPSPRDLDDHIEDPDFRCNISGEQSSSEDTNFQSSSSEASIQRGISSSRRGRPRGRGRTRGRGRGERRFGGASGRGGKGIKRGPRKPIEPSQEFKALDSQAHSAYFNLEYDKAEELIQQAILVNPEMFSAHSLLSAIHIARGDKEKAITALFHGAHTNPRDVGVWFEVLRQILERGTDDRIPAYRDALYCYNRIIEADAYNIEARYQRAFLNRELGYKGRAAHEYERLLKLLPYNFTVLRCLAEVYVDLRQPLPILKHYEDAIKHSETRETTEALEFTWSDLNVYTELFGHLGRYEEGISKIKSLSRWLLGRREETYWDAYIMDDREWDADDQPRRCQCQEFFPDAFPRNAYGQGLPLELRVKLGVYRIKADSSKLSEALNHFEWLDPDDDRPGAKLLDYPDLFREAANALRKARYFEESLRFYEPLQRVNDYNDISLLPELAESYRAVGLTAEAVNCHQKIVDNDNSNIEARVSLADLYGELGMPKKAFDIINEVVAPRRLNTGSMPLESINPLRGSATVELASALNAKHDVPAPAVSPICAMLTPVPRPVKYRSGEHAVRRETLKVAQADNCERLFVQIQALEGPLREGNEEALLEWMKGASILLRDFRSNKFFFPSDKHMRLQDNRKESNAKSVRLKAVRAIAAEEVANRLQVSSGHGTVLLPEDYHGIPFSRWLDTFLRYAMLLAQKGDSKAAYGVLVTATEATPFYSSSDFLFLTHVCWCACALVANDEETLCSVARWFMKEFQFVTDSYRLYSALNLVCNTSKSWYNSGPSQKFLLRQVKAVDFSLVGEDAQKSLYQERASYSTKDDHGDPIPADEMDVALLMLYGHILYTGTSYSLALNYFFRAYALDPANPMVNFSLAVGYIHYALKRQSENRHYFIMQGLSFLFAYYHSRKASNTLPERQEAEYNVARVYHMLGLTQLAVPYYERCISLSISDQQEKTMNVVEDFASEAALALQGLWATTGEFNNAYIVTEKFLRI